MKLSTRQLLFVFLAGLSTLAPHCSAMEKPPESVTVLVGPDAARAQEFTVEAPLLAQLPGLQAAAIPGAGPVRVTIVPPVALEIALGCMRIATRPDAALPERTMAIATLLKRTCPTLEKTNNVLKVLDLFGATVEDAFAIAFVLHYADVNPKYARAALREYKTIPTDLQQHVSQAAYEMLNQMLARACKSTFRIKTPPEHLPPVVRAILHGMFDSLHGGNAGAAFSRTLEDITDLRGLALVPKISTITRLDLSSRDLTELPAEIGQLTQLRILNLHNNLLKSLPPEIIQLEQLRGLGLRNNRFATLTPEIARSQNLTSLDLSFNRLASLPPAVGDLTHLLELFLGNNALETVPAEIGKLTHLKTLRLDNNHLRSLPQEINQLNQLLILEIDNNHFLTAEIERTRNRLPRNCLLKGANQQNPTWADWFTGIFRG